MIDGENKFFTTIVCDSDEEWLEQRRNGVGGSDVAAIMGISKWSTPMRVWMQKLRPDPNDDISDKPYVRFGTFMEPHIGAWYQSEHPDREVRRVNAICQSIDRPWAQASLDFEVRDPDLGWGVLEIKTAGNDKDWQDGVPQYYLTQVIHYMSVTGRAFADVAVFFRDTCEFSEYRVMRDEEDIDAVNDAVDDFWHNYVETGVMPDIMPDDMSAYAFVTGSPDGEIVEDGDPETDEIIARYLDASEAERSARETKRAASAELVQRIGNHKGLSTMTSVVTWTRKHMRRFDVKRFMDDHRDLYDLYCVDKIENGGIKVRDI